MWWSLEFASSGCIFHVSRRFYILFILCLLINRLLNILYAFVICMHPWFLADAIQCLTLSLLCVTVAFESMSFQLLLPAPGYCRQMLFYTALRWTLWFCLWVCLHVGLSVCLLVKNEACDHSSACVYNSGASMIAVPCTTDFHAVTVFLVFCTLMVICSVCKRFSTAFWVHCF